MAFQISPGVSVREIDLTTVVPAVSSTIVGHVGEFQWGPLNERVDIGSEDEYTKTFWKPNNDNAVRWFTGANFLQYGNALVTVRVADEGANSTYNATAEATTGANTAGEGFLVKNDDHYEANYDDGSLNVGQWIAKFPGALGNSLKVSTCASPDAYESTLTGTVAITANSSTVTGTGTAFDTETVVGDLLVVNGLEIRISAVANSTSLTLSNAHSNGASANTATRRWEFFNTVNGAPGQSLFANNVGGTGDEMHVVVQDEDGEISSQSGTVLEVYEKVSKASDAKKDNGASNYYKEVINRQSDWIRWADHWSDITNVGTSATNKTFGTPSLPSTWSLAGGRRGGAPGNNDFIRGYDKFKNADDVDVSLLLGGDANQTVALHLIDNIVNVRKDCIACISPERADVVDNETSATDDIIAFRNQLPSTSYAVMDSGWKYQYDKYNDVYRFIPFNGDVAGAIVTTDLTRDPWWSPGGYNRGKIKNVIKMAYNPSDRLDRDKLYRNGINPILREKGLGVNLIGDKTMLSQPSAFDRINVRRLFIVLEKAISTAAKFLLFEFNDEFTRAQFRNIVEPYLRDVQGRRGITDFYVQCDETNNTGEVIDRNEFVGSIFVKPNRSINFIRLDFVAVRTNVEFNEVIQFG